MALTSQSILRDRILMTLDSIEGARATRAETLAAVGEAFATVWTSADLEPPKSRPWDTKGQNRASFERADMVHDGLLVDRADGTWALTTAGRQAANALVLGAAKARAAELVRRELMWEAIVPAGGPANLAPSVLNDLRTFRGGRGIYADGDSTRGVLGSDGVAVSFLHNGSSYADELSTGGVRYHYPKTGRNISWEGSLSFWSSDIRRHRRNPGINSYRSPRLR